MYKKEPIKGFEEYCIDTNGIVYNKNGSIKKYSLNPSGYCIVNLYVNHKRYGFSIHQLVARQFIENPYGYLQINHKNGNKEDNSVKNLEWCNNQYNALHSFRVLGRKNKPINCKRILFFDKDKKLCYNFDSISNAARFFTEKGRNHRYIVNSILRVLKGKRKTYKGYTVKYAEVSKQANE